MNKEEIKNYISWYPTNRYDELIKTYNDYISDEIFNFLNEDDGILNSIIFINAASKYDYFGKYGSEYYENGEKVIVSCKFRMIFFRYIDDVTKHRIENNVRFNFTIDKFKCKTLKRKYKIEKFLEGDSNI